MLRLVLSFLPVLLASAAVAEAVLPPGYEGIIEITSDTVADNLWPAINNHGQIVWSRRSDPYDDSTAEIFLYDNGVITQLTNDSVRDSFPNINDAGDIVWSRAIGAGNTLEIVRYHEGTITRLTNDSYSDYEPRLNNSGHIVWYKWIGGGCLDANADIYLYTGATTKRLTFGGTSNQGARLNESGGITWTRYDFCNFPYWTGTIMLRTGGMIYELTDDDGPLECPDINDNGLVAWHGRIDYVPADSQVFQYQDGTTSILTWGYNTYLNSRGDMAFDRWHDDTQTWQVWLYRAGQFYQLTDDPTWNFGGGIDEHGNFVFVSGDDYTVMTNIRLLKRRPPGDLNCDGAVNGFDIDPFVAALTDLEQYQAQYADCDATLADLNLDRSVDVFDIDPFVEALTR